MAYSHILKMLKDPLYTEDDVIIQLIPYLNGSQEIRAFSQRLKCKHDAKYLLDKQVIEIYQDEDSKAKGIHAMLNKKSPKSGCMVV